MTRLESRPSSDSTYQAPSALATTPPPPGAATSEPIRRVWLRRTAVVCKVRVESPEAAVWLRGQLPTGFACSDPEPIPGGNGCTFRVALGLSTSFGRLQRTIEELPAATLMLDPA